MWTRDPPPQQLLNGSKPTSQVKKRQKDAFLCRLRREPAPHPLKHIHMTSIGILSSRGIFMTKIYSILIPPPSLIAILNTALDVHSYCMSHGRLGDSP